MSKKTLNETNLAALGADRLASLLIEVSTGSAEIKRRLRLELSHNLGPEELARDVRKRLSSIRRSTSFVGWRKRKTLIKDLSTQAEMIIDKIAPEAPAPAFDLLWQFVEMAPSVYERVDDSRGDVGDVFRSARNALADIAPNAGQEPKGLARQVWDAVRDNGYGEFDGIISLLGPALGQDGLEHLKHLVAAYKDTPLERDDDNHAAVQFLRNLRSDGGDYAAEQKARLIRHTLQEIAEAQGDTNAYIAQYSPQDLSRPGIAAEVATLLLNEGQAQEALQILEAADRDGRGRDNADWDMAYIACLTALDRLEDAQTHRWSCFCDRLEPQYLRDYLKVLPDFEDIEAEEAARAHALTFDHLMTALKFFIAWPDLASAARLIETRAPELDGDFYHILTPAAESLRDRHPLAAVILWRSMIEFALHHGRSTRYGHAADHLMDCLAADMEITEYGPFEPHEVYLQGLRQRHERKSSFWARLPSRL